MSMSLYDLVIKHGTRKEGGPDAITKKEFGRVMHDPHASDAEIQHALELLETAGGYENLGD